MTATASYDRIPFVYPNAVNAWTYAGTDLLVPASAIKIDDVVLKIPPRLVGKRLRVRVLIEEDRP